MKIYPDFSHRMLTVNAATLNADMFEFIRSCKRQYAAGEVIARL